VFLGELEMQEGLDANQTPESLTVTHRPERVAGSVAEAVFSGSLGFSANWKGSIDEQERKLGLLLRKRMFTYLLCINLLILVPTLIIFFLQGFRIWGFDLPPAILYSLMATAMGTVAESFYLAVRSTFSEHATMSRRRRK
jgi:hypothetical protein